MLTVLSCKWCLARPRAVSVPYARPAIGSRAGLTLCLTRTRSNDYFASARPLDAELTDSEFKDILMYHLYNSKTPLLGHSASGSKMPLEGATQTFTRFCLKHGIINELGEKLVNFAPKTDATTDPANGTNDKPNKPNRGAPRLTKAQLRPPGHAILFYSQAALGIRSELICDGPVSTVFASFVPCCVGRKGSTCELPTPRFGRFGAAAGAGICEQ